MLPNLHKVINKPNKIQNQESEMPSFEVIIKRHTTDCSLVWDASKIPLYRYARSHMEKQQKPLKVSSGCGFTIVKPMPIGDMSMSWF